MGSVVGYFEYSDDKNAAEALKEQDKIMKLEKQVNYDNPKLVYSLYNKIIDSNAFHTPEGILYLVHLQDYLNEQDDPSLGAIKPIKVKDFIDLQGYSEGTAQSLPKSVNASETMEDISNEIREADASGDDSFEAERQKYLDKIRALELERSKAYRTLKIKKNKTDNFIYKMIIAFLAVLLVIMFVISVASGGPNILNYRQEIQNEYSDWQMQLEQKEKELNEREQQLPDK